MSALLFYTVGLPGAGKTTLARNLATLLQAEHLRGDKIGLELFRFPTYSPDERRMVQAEMSQRAQDALRAGRHVIFDAANNTTAQRQHVERLAAQTNSEAIGLWVQTALPVSKRRAGQARDSGLAGAVVRVIPPHIFDQYVAAFELPQQGESIIILSGEAGFYLQYRRLRRALQAAGVALPLLI